MIPHQNCHYRIVISLRYGTLGWPGRQSSPHTIGTADSTSDDVDESWVLFQVYDHTQPGSAAVALIEATPESIGLVLEYRDALSTIERDAYVLPPHVVAGLKAIVKPSERASEVVWLEIARPAGYMPAVPWERLLLESCGIAGIRVGSGVSPVLVPPAELDAVLCFSCPIDQNSDWTAERIVDLFIQMMPKSTLQRPTTLHVFADKDTRPILQKNRSRFSTMSRVVIYTPRPDAAYLDLENTTSVTRRVPKDRMSQTLLQLRHVATRAIRAIGREAPPATPLENPWLVWMRDELTDIAVEYVHFVCHGYLGRETGGLVFANAFSTDDPRWLRHVSARELNDFLSWVGAWSVGASSAPNNMYTGGMRYCFEDLAALRLGPIVLHDMRSDKEHDALRKGYRISAEPGFTGSPAITAWWHPDYAYTADENDSDSTPAWVMKTQRAIKLTSAVVNKMPQTDYDAALLKGVSAALALTSSLLSESVKTDLPKDRTR